MNITRSPGQDLIPDSVLIHILANRGQWTGAARRGNDIGQISLIQPHSDGVENDCSSLRVIRDETVFFDENSKK